MQIVTLEKVSYTLKKSYILFLIYTDINRVGVKMDINSVKFIDRTLLCRYPEFNVAV